MKRIRLIFFSSALHENVSVMNTRQPLLEGLRKFANVEIIYPTMLMSKKAAGGGFLDSFERSGNARLIPEDTAEEKTVCFIGTGGTEEIFRSFLDILPHPVHLLSDGFHNSFAAALEIATFLQQNGIERDLYNAPLDCSESFFKSFEEELFGTSGKTAAAQLKATDVPELARQARNAMSRTKIGLIGGASSWLISSGIDRKAVSDKYGVTFVDIELSELEKEFTGTAAGSPEAGKIADRMERFLTGGRSRGDLVEAARMYIALRAVCTRYSLGALTLKCFDMLSSCRTTSCLALAMLNDEGIVSGCEGDIPALFTMLYAKLALGKASFMANPSSSNREELTIDFAHCTIPLSMVHGFRLPSHFESSIGIGIAGSVPSGCYRIIKISGEKLDRFHSFKGEIIMNTNVPQRCRTQVRFRFSSEDDFNAFISESKGNHIVLVTA